MAAKRAKHRELKAIGYGDRFSVTDGGRIIGIFVMTVGVGLFGTLSGFLANSFLSPPKKEEADLSIVDEETPKAKPATLKRLIEAQEQATADLKAQLEEVDKML